MQKVKDIYTYISKFINTRINRVVSTFQNSLNISKKEAIIYIKTILLFFVVLLFVSYCFQYDNFISFVVSAFVTIIYYSFISRDLRKHNRKIKDLQRKYNKNVSYPLTATRIVKIIVAVLVSLLAYWLLFEIDLGENILEQIIKSLDKDSKSIIQFKVLIITAPIIFVIWIFRDKNKLLEIENNRKDTNLKEFQQLQRWATGNIDGENKDNKIALQISALHSLRDYLKGEYGESFRRGAYEIFRSVLKRQHDKILKSIKEQTIESIQEAINKCQLTTQLNVIASEEWFNLLINHDFPTEGISLVGVKIGLGLDDGLDGVLDRRYLKHKKYDKTLNLDNSNLSGCNFHGAIFGKTSFYNANLSNSFFQHVDINESNLYKTNLVNAHLLGVNFKKSNLIETNLSGANLEYAKFDNLRLTSVKMNASNLSNASFRNTKIGGTFFDSSEINASNLYNTNFNGAKIFFSEMIGSYFESYEKNLTLFDRLNSRVGKETELSGFLYEDYILENATTGKLTQEKTDEIIKNYNKAINA
jgi:uncharacterized protein YjbI with pentapeptide repeats